MSNIDELDARIGRRIKLRDLHVFAAVAQAGSMAKAAAKLRVTQPAISQTIADLEGAVGVRLFDRSMQGVDLTAFGRVLLAGGAAAFDSLKQTMKEIELLSDPTRGEVRIGCPETVAALLPPIIESYSHLRPGVSLLVREIVAPTLDLPLLREREIDLAVVRVAGEPARHRIADDLQVETLFDDELLIVAGVESQWARRTTPRLADLAHEGWILPPANTLTSEVIMKAFQEHNLGKPRISLVTFSVSLRISLVSGGRYITVLPKSIMQTLSNRASLKVLSIGLPVHQWPIVLVTLKNRLLNSAAQHFIETLKAGMCRPLS